MEMLPPPPPPPPDDDPEAPALPRPAGAVSTPWAPNVMNSPALNGWIQENEQGRSVPLGGENLIEIGTEFNPEERYAKEVGIFQRNLPKTVYSAVILEYLCEDTAGRGLRIVLRSAVLPLALTAVAQVVFASYLRLGVIEVQGDLAGNCHGTSFVLKCVAMFAFVGLVAGHLLQVFEMHMWLNMFGSTLTYERLKIKKYETRDPQRAVEEARAKQRCSSGPMVGPMPKVRREASRQIAHEMSTPDVHVVHRPVSGLRRIERFMFYIFILMPSFCATCFVGWSGAGAVMRASNDVDLVMNSVAAVFVVELDNYAYNLLMPPTIRNKTERLPPLNMAIKEGSHFAMHEFVVNFYSWVVSFLIIGASIGLYGVWCGFELLGAPASNSSWLGECTGNGIFC